jgi:starch synthase
MTGPASLNILLVTPEAAPFSKTGGLADMTGSLALALARLGHTVTILTPRYRGLDIAARPIGRVRAVFGDGTHDADLVEHALAERVRVVLVDYAPYYDRDGLYGAAGVDYPDNGFRFALLAQAAAGLVGDGLQPAVVHAHEWQAGLTPVYLSRGPGGSAHGRPPTVFTIHNLAYQGMFPAAILPVIGLDWSVFTASGLEYWGQASFLKAGITFSDVVTTVSPRYAEEILTPEYAFGFEGVLEARRDRLVGILNGIDESVWNPATDPYLPATYDARNLEGKSRCKAELLRTFGLPHEGAAGQRALIGMVSRMVDQKGLDLLAEASEELPGLDAAFAVVGTGERRYEEMWTRLAARHPDRIGVRIGFDERLAHLVEAGADLFLMPSRFEPCGLNQMYSMRYGTVPVVRATGGLYDTVEDFDERTGRGTGFRFEEYTPEALFQALARALSAFQHKPIWQTLMLAGMRQDHSWDRSAQEYVRVYQSAIESARHQTADF